MEEAAEPVVVEPSEFVAGPFDLFDAQIQSFGGSVGGAGVVMVEDLAARPFVNAGCAIGLARVTNWAADQESAALSGYQRTRDRLSWAMYQESAALAAYGWDPAEASTRMRGISQSVREECEALEALPSWAEATSAA